MADKDKKQLLLRLSPTLWEEISRWAEDDFRSINGQIEYLLTEAVKKRRKVKIEEENEESIVADAGVCHGIRHGEHICFRR